MSPRGPDDSRVIRRRPGPHHPAQRPCLNVLLQPDRRVLVTGCEPVTEPHAGEVLRIEQDGHAARSAVASDDDLGVAHPVDERQALLGLARWPVGAVSDPVAAEEGIDAGLLSATSLEMVYEMATSRPIPI